MPETSMWGWFIHGLYHPFLVILKMVYGWVYQTYIDLPDFLMVYVPPISSFFC